MGAVNWRNSGAITEDTIFAVHPVIAALAHDVHGLTNAALAWMQWSCPCDRGIRTSRHRRSCAWRAWTH